MNIEAMLPENIRSLQPYEAGKTIAEVKKRYHPDQISKLASNENRLGCSPKVFEAIQDAFKDIRDYPDPLATELRSKLADRHQVSESEILLGAGSESIIGMLCRTFFKDDENAVTATGTFVGFFVQSGVRGIEVKKVPLTKNYRFDVKGILSENDPKTRMIYIANPNNPTGTYITKNEYRMLLDSIPENLLLVMDEAYHEYARSLEDYPDSLHARQENVITLRTFSKAYGLAGMRVGYAVAEKNLIEQMIKTKLTFEPPALGQKAAVAALDDPSFIEKSVNMVAEEREKLYDFFDERDARYVRSAANSVMLILEDESEAITFTESMLKEGVILRRANAFGLPNCIRITIGTGQEMTHFKESYHKVLQTPELKS